MNLNLQTIFNAGRVRRWHKNAALSWTDDYNDGHQGRVARLILALHPKPSNYLLAAALTHDDGEIESGDMDAEFKRSNPIIADALQKFEDAATCKMWGVNFTPSSALNPKEKSWLKFCDRLDAYMWVKHKQPSELEKEDWQRQNKELKEFAEKNGITAYVEEILS